MKLRNFINSLARIRDEQRHLMAPKIDTGLCWGPAGKTAVAIEPKQPVVVVKPLNRAARRAIEFESKKQAATPKPEPQAPVVVPLADWLKCQPGSTRRGVARGRFQLPSYVRAS